MKLTGTEINKAYSEQLAKLLLDGYTLVVARENGSLEKNKDDFAKVELKVGKILECQPHPKADRLLVFKIDIGDEVRTIVSGIRKYYSETDLIGKKVIVVTNLKPVNLRGVESNGMILAASDDENLSVLTVLNDVKEGSEVS